MTTRPAIYLDHNASAPLLPAAREAMVAAMSELGNPSSVHSQGRTLRKIIDAARDKVAVAAGAKRRDVVFTGTATEALTQAIVAGARHFSAKSIVISAGEHAAVIKAAEMTGLPVRLIGLRPDGLIDMEQIDAVLNELAESGARALFAFHAVNNETGVVQDISRVEAKVGPTEHVLVIDAVQAFGKMDLDFESRATDMMAISAHKIGGPAGIGTLLVKPHCDDVKLVPGGGQEMGRRGGTESHILAAGFGAAAERFANAYIEAEPEKLSAQLETGLRVLAPDTVVFGGARLGNVVDFAVPGVKSAVAMMALDLEGISVSSGSACSSGKVGRSHVLDAMSVSSELADCALRVSFGWSSSEEDVSAFLAAFERILARARRDKGQAA